MPWFDGIKTFLTAVETEYDRRIRSASNIKEYHPEGGGHGHGHHLTHDHDAEHDHAALAEGSDHAESMHHGVGTGHS